VTKAKDALGTFVQLVEENPYAGTAEQIVTLSLGIAEAATQLDASTFSLFKEQSGIGEKVFSKLKVIGKTLLKLTETQRREVVKGLPASYSTIHLLCSISPEELVTGVKSKNITPTISVREARDYTKQVRFPQMAAVNSEKGRWGAKQEQLWSVFRPEEMPLGGEALQSLEEALREVCQEHGVLLRQANTAGTRTLREEERGRRAAFWREMLEKELTQKWFKGLSEDVKKQFNLKTIDEVRDTPLRNFTGFLIRADGGREHFWEKHGQAYVAKVHFLMESTEDRAQKYNLKRRLEEVLGDRKELAVWRNVIWREMNRQ
jgi:hypothetical protein